MLMVSEDLRSPTRVLFFNGVLPSVRDLVMMGWVEARAMLQPTFGPVELFRRDDWVTRPVVSKWLQCISIMHSASPLPGFQSAVNLVIS